MSSDVIVMWDHAGNTNTISGYHIFYGPASRTYTNSVMVGYITNAIITNIPNNVTIYYSGKTVAPDGEETDFGNELQFIAVSSTNSLPSQVKDFRLTKMF